MLGRQALCCAHFCSSSALTLSMERWSLLFLRAACTPLRLAPHASAHSLCRCLIHQVLIAPSPKTSPYSDPASGSNAGPTQSVQGVENRRWTVATMARPRLACSYQRLSPSRGQGRDANRRRRHIGERLTPLAARVDSHGRGGQRARSTAAGFRFQLRWLVCLPAPPVRSSLA